MVTNSGTFGRALAHRLLAHEAGMAHDSGDTAASGSAVCQKLLAEIEQFIGHDGFKALLARALHMARVEFPFLAEVQIGESDEGWLIGLSENIATRDATEVSDSIAAVLGGFIDLLGTFIGHDLTLRMIHRRWPEVPQRPHPGDEGQRDG